METTLKFNKKMLADFEKLELYKHMPFEAFIYYLVERGFMRVVAIENNAKKRRDAWLKARGWK